MTGLSYDDAPLAIRADLAAEHSRVWAHISGPGLWLTGETRVAIAAEVRNAADCSLCAERNSVLSPYAVDGIHDNLDELSSVTVEMIHRIVNDSGRLTQDWYKGLLIDGLSEDEYVETLAVLAITICVDTFTHALGLAQRSLPTPITGVPEKSRPERAVKGLAWVPWISKENTIGDDLNTFGPEASNVRRALSLVPNEAHSFMRLVAAQYLSAFQMKEFNNDSRAIMREQIELIAGRISAINQCAY